MACTGSGRSPGSSFFRNHRGGFMVVVAFVELFVALGLPYNYNILVARLQEEFGSGVALTGWIGSLANTLVFCSPVSPLLIQRFGPRAVALLGTVLFSGGFVATSFVSSLTYAYFTFGILVGVGGNLMAQSVMIVIFDWFPDKNCSRATSMAWLGTSFGLLAFAPIFSSLIAAYGWRNCLRIVAGCSFVICLANGAFIVTPAKVKGQKQDTSNEQDNKDSSVAAIGVDSVDKVGSVDNVDKIDNADTVGIVDNVDIVNNVDIVTKIDIVDPAECAHKTLRQRIRKISIQPETWIWLFGFLMSNIGWTFVVINYASFMESDLHFTTDQITVALVLAAVGEILGKVLFSIFGDYLPCLKLYVVAATGLLAAAITGLMTVLRTVPLVYTISFLVGPVRGASYVSPCTAAMELFGDYGSDIATVLFMIPMGAGLFIGALLTGGLYDLTGDYTLSLHVTIAIFVCAAISMLIIPLGRRLRSRKSPGRSRPSTDMTKFPAENPVSIDI